MSQSNGQDAFPYQNVAGEAVLKRIDTSALRKDLLQINGVYARISKLKYELYDLRKRSDLNYVALGVVMACKDEGQRLELEEKEK